MAKNTARMVWTPDLDARLRELYPVMSWAEMQVVLSTTRASIKMRALRLGICRQPRIRTTECVCKRCGSVFSITNSKIALNYGIYCTQECRAQNYKEGKAKKWIGDKNKIDIPCSWCNKPLKKFPCQIKTGHAFCSRRCGGAFTMKKQGGRTSKLEEDFCAHLSKLGLVFERQFRFGTFLLDVAFPEKKIAVEVDGDYWHSLPNVVEKDRRKDAAITAGGWSIVHVTEKEIRCSIEHAGQRVLKIAY